MPWQYILIKFVASNRAFQTSIPGKTYRKTVWRVVFMQQAAVEVMLHYICFESWIMSVQFLSMPWALPGAHTVFLSASEQAMGLSHISYHPHSIAFLWSYGYSSNLTPS
ncbi:unnamed protein product [Ilex paraguariensis]|uniref:Uncharacterized protein n=1 Tax=Ilex paraguariensis TaxID=185542 RepID=A0ABC8U513_9AQUA